MSLGVSVELLTGLTVCICSGLLLNQLGVVRNWTFLSVCARLVRVYSSFSRERLSCIDMSIEDIWSNCMFFRICVELLKALKV